MTVRFKIFTDFDGTIALNDVGDSLFSRFAGPEWIVPVNEWKERKITSKECLTRECSLTTVKKEDLDSFCNEQKIDPYFKKFYEYCISKNFPILVLSDGLDYYIRKILNQHGFENLEVYSNKLIFENQNKIKPEFPHFEKGCLFCANCKGYHIKEKRKNGELAVCIGDGLSDSCGVKEADIVFAKDDLKQYCIDNNIDHFEFVNFNDVLNKLKEIEIQR